ncbi:MAG: ParB/RepB/Spo0J family partition protein [Candidatus Schekmanbacteria bacterium]|nr:ParB/RepB/Spo0J family partition protein [Candidatus Schekmanbacteria bacterium]
MKRPALGRGLEALLPSEPVAESGARLVRLDRIEVNPDQPRSGNDESALRDLADSVLTHGVLQPIVVTQNGLTDTFTIIAGERRWRAAKLAGLHEIPVVVREASTRDRLELALVENIQRQDLNPIEEARAFQRLAEEFSLTHHDIARRVGKDRTTITNSIRLLSTSATIQQLLADGKLSMGHARALVGLDPATAERIAADVLSENLSVRQTEELAARARCAPEDRVEPASASPPPAPTPLANLERELRETLSTRVQLRGGEDKGAITIYYHSSDELERLRELLIGARSPI